MKTLSNTTASQAKDNVSDLKIWGNGNAFKLICKASSEKEGWMKSTKAMEIEGVGCVIQVTTQQQNGIPRLLHVTTGDNVREMNISEGYNISTKDPLGNYSVAEAVTFIPGVRIEETEKDGAIVSRKLVAIT